MSDSEFDYELDVQQDPERPGSQRWIAHLLDAGMVTEFGSWRGSREAAIASLRSVLVSQHEERMRAIEAAQ